MTSNIMTKKSIRFSPVVEVYQPPNILCSTLLTEEERNAVWYSVEQLDMMKNEARTISREFRFLMQKTEENKISTTATPANNQVTRRVSITKPNEINCVGANDDDSSCDEDSIITKSLSEPSNSIPICPRGLEGRVCFERQKNKLLALRAVQECHFRLKQKDFEDQLTGRVYDKKYLDSASKLAIISSKCTRWARDVALACGTYDFEQAYPELVYKTNSTYQHPTIIRPFPAIFKKRQSGSSNTNCAVKRRRISQTDQCSSYSSSVPATIPIHC